MTIPSQANQEWLEGVETRESMREPLKSPRARSALMCNKGDDIVRYSNES